MEIIRLYIKLNTNDNFPVKAGQKVRIENAGDTEWMMATVLSTSTLSDSAGATLVLNFSGITYGNESAFNTASNSNWRLVRINYVGIDEGLDVTDEMILDAAQATRTSADRSKFCSCI